jgi:hypothetical protein
LNESQASSCSILFRIEYQFHKSIQGDIEIRRRRNVFTVETLDHFGAEKALEGLFRCLGVILHRQGRVFFPVGGSRAFAFSVRKSGAIANGTRQEKNLIDSSDLPVDEL